MFVSGSQLAEPAIEPRFVTQHQAKQTTDEIEHGESPYLLYQYLDRNPK